MQQIQEVMRDLGETNEGFVWADTSVFLETNASSGMQELITKATQDSPILLITYTGHSVFSTTHPGSVFCFAFKY
jgi:hypothetical protein